ncbi:MAG: bacillithiol biosynthesis deacetylase BshB1 [Acidobacteria bacterium]|nr:bacillithiol biosynthesis deacetylase BshB1 [Acidobacteriota bacterium]
MIIYETPDTTELDALTVVAHPDDAEIGMGGTIALLVDRGYRVGILDLTRGEMASRGTPEQRLEESRTASKTLGIAVRLNMGLPDGFLQPEATARLELVRVLRSYRPLFIFTHHLRDPHPDHTAAYQLVRQAAHNAGLGKLDEGLPPFRPKYLFTFGMPHRWQPSFLVDVSQYWEQKIAAVRCFHSQVSPLRPGEPETYLGDPGFLDSLDAQSRSYGSLVGVTHAEYFHTEIMLLVADPIEAFKPKRGRFL